MRSQILPKPSPNPPKPSPNPGQIDPKSIWKASGRPSWTYDVKKLAFGRPQNCQEPPKNAQERPQTGPNPPQMSPRPSQNHRLERFFGFYVPKFCLQRFRGRCFDIFRACAGRHVCLYVLPDTVLMGREHVFAKSTFSIKMRKNFEKTLPKPSRNPPQTSKNQSKIPKNRQKNAR